MSEKKRYILETNDNCQRIALMGACDGLVVMVDKAVDKLKDADEAIEEAYKSGFEVGQHEATTLEYQQGLNDAWEAARKIFGDEVDGGLPVNELRNAFGFENVPFYTADILRTNTASEAIAKLKAYEEQQKQNKRIMFGDGLVTKTGGINGIALSNEVNSYVFVWREDCVAYEASVDEWKKTGKTYSQLAELLKAMKGGAE